MQKAKVSVVMITYGHEKYLKQAVEGVLMQDYNGEIELIIANDKSPDQSDFIVNEIIASHPNRSWIKYTSHKTNLGMMPNFIWALNQVKGKYIAICEGDDYWTDPLKLQKQIDFLEENPEYAMTFHNALVVSGKTAVGYQRFLEIKDRDYDEIELFKNWIVPTASMVFRKTVLRHPKFIAIQKERDLFFGDNLLLIVSSQIGKLRGFKEVMSAYRLHGGGQTFHVNYVVHSKLNKQNILFGKYFPSLKSSIDTIVRERNYTNFKKSIKLMNLKEMFTYLFYWLKYRVYLMFWV